MSEKTYVDWERKAGVLTKVKIDDRIFALESDTELQVCKSCGETKDVSEFKEKIRDRRKALSDTLPSEAKGSDVLRDANAFLVKENEGLREQLSGQEKTIRELLEMIKRVEPEEKTESPKERLLEIETTHEGREEQRGTFDDKTGLCQVVKQRRCPRCSKMKNLIDFTEKDRWCKECRKTYNKNQKEKKEKSKKNPKLDKL